jgi:hypothetical protein
MKLKCSLPSSQNYAIGHMLSQLNPDHIVYYKLHIISVLYFLGILTKFLYASLGSVHATCLSYPIIREHRVRLLQIYPSACGNQPNTLI